MEGRLNLLYKPCRHCAPKGAELTLAMPSEDELNRWLRSILRKKGKDVELHIPSVLAFADHLWGAVQEGYGKQLVNVDFGSPDHKMLSHLKNNVYQFSMAKNHAELQALTGAVVDANDKVRSWEQFRQEAVKITGKFRNAWLQAEYELAVAGGQMASKWQEFESTGEDSMLRYSTVGDNRVSNICKPLDGVTKPLSDPFWDTYYPPNHFRCRCDVDRVPYGTKATPSERIAAPNIPKMMRTNLAKRGLVFPIDHPYFIGYSEAALQNYFLRIPYEKQFITRKGENFKRHLLTFLPEYQDKNQWERILINAQRLGKIAGTDIRVLPELPLERFATLREMILPGTDKNPDYLVNGVYADLKSAKIPFTEASFRNRVDNAAKQSKFPIIELIDTPEQSALEDECKRRITGKKLDGLIVFNEKGKLLFKYGK